MKGENGGLGPGKEREGSQERRGEGMGREGGGRQFLGPESWVLGGIVETGRGVAWRDVELEKSEVEWRRVVRRLELEPGWRA